MTNSNNYTSHNEEVDDVVYFCGFEFRKQGDHIVIYRREDGKYFGTARTIEEAVHELAEEGEL